MVLDTDTISYFLRGNESVKAKIIEHQKELASTTVNYSELIYGLTKKESKKYLPKVELVFENIKLYSFDKKSAYTFGLLKANMQKEGIVVADKDLMIASIALTYDEVLISNNIKHFSKVEGLRVETWVG